MSSYEYSYAVEEMLGTGVLAGLLESGLSMILGIATYVLTALALYTIAKRRGLNKPWLSWIPVANSWIVGSLSDQYRYVVKGENKSKRKALLTLNIIITGIWAVMIVGVIVMVVQAVVGAMGGMSEEHMLETVMGPAIGMAGLSLPLAGIAIAYAIIYYMALYDIYKSLDPGNCVLFLVLSILIGVTEPFFLFFNRNKDLGMPPRRSNPTYIPPEPDWQPQRPAQEPWKQENKDYL